MKYGIIFMSCGLIYGVIIAILFCQINNKKRSIASFGIGCIVSAFMAVYNVFTDEPSINKADVFIWFILFFIIGFILCFAIYIYYLNKQEDRNFKVKPIDILMNNYNILEAQYRDMEAEIENRNKIKNEELIAKGNEIEAAKQELRTFERKVREQINQGVYMNVGKQHIPMTQYFVDRIPEYVENMANYMTQLNKKNDMFIKNYNQHRHNKEQFVQGYLYAIAMITCKVLFDTNKDVIVCAEYVVDGKVNKICTNADRTDSIYKVTGDNAIFAVKENGLDNEVKKREDEDIMLIEFNKVHIIKMEIRIRNKSKYREYRSFLKYCKIDQIIQFFLLEFIDACNIINKREATNG